MPLVSKLPMSGKKSLILPDNANITGVYSYDGELKVQWDVPKGSETPIDHFNLYWVKADEKPTSLKQFTNKTEISADTTEITLRDLENQAKYWLIIESVSDEGYENASLRKANTGSTGEAIFVRQVGVRTANSAVGGGYVYYVKPFISSNGGKKWGLLKDTILVQQQFMPAGGRAVSDVFRRDGSFLMVHPVYYIAKVTNYDNFIMLLTNSSGNSFYNGAATGLSVASMNGATVFVKTNNRYVDDKGIARLAYMLDSNDELVALDNIQYGSLADPCYDAYCSVVNGKFFLFMHTSKGKCTIRTSSNGINWETIDISDNTVITARNNGVVYFNGMYITERMYYSTNMVDWISFKNKGVFVTSGNTFTPTYFCSIVTFNKKVFVYYANNAGTYNCITSEDGINWTTPQSSNYQFGNVSNLCQKNGIMQVQGSSAYNFQYTIDGINLVNAETSIYYDTLDTNDVGGANTFQ
nr:MAG TPA: NETRIN-1, NETRIN RECEPTOR DCC BINDING, APOPTOSIS, AXON GUIDANCE [Caudoviricetes sp.]